MSDLRKKLAGQKTRLATKNQKATQQNAVFGDYLKGNIVNISVQDILPNPYQPRQYFDKQSLEELSQSIKERGILQPIIISDENREDRKVYLADGERRWRAAKMAGIDSVPAVVTKGNLDEIALIVNLQRENFKPIEEAVAFKLMMKEHGYTQDQLAKVVGKAQPSISETLSLNNLPDEIKKECQNTDIYPKRQLIQVARQKTPKAMLALFEKVKAANLERGQVKDNKKRKVRTPAAVTDEKCSQFILSLDKLDINTIEDIHRDQLIKNFIKTFYKIRQKLEEMNVEKQVLNDINNWLKSLDTRLDD
jgi:ParB family chromosome partitioning protein